MAEVNEYFKDKYEEETKEFKGKIRRHRMSIVYRILLIIAIIAAVLGAFYYNYQKMVYSGYDVLRSIEYTEAATAHYLAFNGNVLRYSQDGASAFNMDNDMIWNETYQMQNPMVDSCGDYVALGDYKGTSIYVFNSTGLMGTIDTTIPLQRFCVSGNGNVAAVLEEDDVTWVKLYDQLGNNIANDRTTMAKSGYPVDVDLSEDGILLAVSYLYMDSGVLSTSVAFYNFGAVGENEIDNLVSGYNYSNTIVSYVEFINSKTCIAVGDNRFIIFSGDQKPESVFEMAVEDEIQSVFYNAENIGLVFNNDNAENRYRLDIYDIAGNLKQQQEFSKEYKDIKFNRDLVIIYNATECEIYNMDGLKKFSGNFKNSAISLIPTGSKTKFLLVSGSKMEEIQLK